MSQPRWTEVDAYLDALFAPPDAALDAARAASRAGGLPDIAVSPVQGKLLFLLATSIGARAILEIGTLGGYSAIWLARALPPEGRLTTLEADAHHAEVARANLAAAGLDNVDVVLGRGQETLPRLIEERAGPFDLVFIDADKTGYPDYLRWSLQLTHPGSLIIADNVVRDGAVADASSTDANVQAVRTFNQMIADEPRLSSTVLQTVGVKGYDGLAFALVR